MKNPKCSAVQVRGYYRGSLCGNGAKFTVRGKPYCHVHYAIAVKEPHRFRESVAFTVRAETRRRMAEREKESQIDAFPVPTTPVDPYPLSRTEQAVSGVFGNWSPSTHPGVTHQ